MKKLLPILFCVLLLSGSAKGQSCSEGAIPSSGCDCIGQTGNPKTFYRGFCCNDIWFDDDAYTQCPTGSWYYVDKDNPSASDSNTGTENQPWEHAWYGSRQLQAGDVLLIKDGYYYDSSFTPEARRPIVTLANGVGGNSEADRITIRAHPGSDVTLAAGPVGAQPNTFVYAAAGPYMNDFVTFDGFNIFGQFEFVASDSCSLINSDIFECGSDDRQGQCVGIDQSDSAVVYNNYIHDGTFSKEAGSGNAPGILTYGSRDALIHHNVIDNMLNGGMYIKDYASGFKIYNNLVKNCGGQGIRATPVQNPPASNEPVEVHNNIVINNDRGIETSIYGKAAKVYSNTIYNSADAGIYIQKSGDQEWFNNIIYNINGRVLAGIEDEASTLPQIDYLDHNIYFKSTSSGDFYTGNGWTKVASTLSEWRSWLDSQSGCGNGDCSLFEDNSIDSNPMFVNAAAGNFHLQPGSPAIGSGRSGSDIGAYPYGDDCMIIGIEPEGYVCGTGTCPDGDCNNGETCSTCPEDCGPCPCTEDWQCTPWGDCIGGQQTRTCTDLNNCGTTNNKPPETQTCTTGGNECENWQTNHPEWIFCDDFEDGTALVRDGRYFEYDSNDGDFIIMDGAGLDNSKGMRALWQTGEVNAGNIKLGFGRNPSGSMNKGIRETEDFREVYYRMYLKMQNGWQGSPDKLSRATVIAASDWSQAMIAHYWSDSQYHLAVDPVRCVDTNNNVKCIGYNDISNMDWLGSQIGITPIFDSAHDDIWFCIESHIKLNDPGQSNGIQEFWLDGQLDARRDGLNFVRSYTDYAINAIFFENHWNDGSPQQQERYFDNIVVSTQPVGCISGPECNINGDCTSPEICCNSQCVTPPDCPNCDDGNPCTTDLCVNYGTCNPTCQNTQITACADDDGCCPSGCTPASDNDCQAGIVTVEFGDHQGSDYPGTVEDTFIDVNHDVNHLLENLNTYTWPANEIANTILIKWDLSALPQDANIQDAKLYLYLTSSGGDSLYDVSVHRLINLNPVISAADGYYYDGVNSWTSSSHRSDGIPLAQSDIASAEDTNTLNIVNEYKEWSVKQMVQYWLDHPNENYGMLVNSDPISSSDSWRYFASSENPNSARRPKLVVTYGQYHRADTNNNGCIEMEELLAFIKRWKISSQDVPMPDLMEAIGLWNSGCS
jgi:hypothetical protein